MLSIDKVFHLKHKAKLSVTGIFRDKALPEELIHDVGEVGHDEDENHRHGQVGCLDPGLGEDGSSVPAVKGQVCLNVK